VPTVGLLVRIRFEERALLDGLGEPYRLCRRPPAPVSGRVV